MKRRIGIGVLVAVALCVVAAFAWVIAIDDTRPYVSADASDTPSVPITYQPLGSASSGAPGSGPTTRPAHGTRACHGSLVTTPGPNFGHFPGKHTVTIHVWSERTIPRLYFWVPTARVRTQGNCAVSDLTRTMTAWGRGPYVQLFIGTVADGTPVHCTITVDGVVRKSLTASGPWSTQLCIA